MTITLELPEDTYRTLLELADQRGESPETLVQATITSMTDDPLERWIGAFDSGTPDWPSRHDQIIGDAAIDPHDVIGADESE